MRYLLVAFLIVLIVSCDKHQNDLIPQLKDDYPKIKTLKFPVLVTLENEQQDYGYEITKVNYNNNQIESIETFFESNSTKGFHSLTVFKYEETILLTAVKYSNWDYGDINYQNIEWNDSAKYSFVRNSEMELISMKREDPDPSSEYIINRSANKQEVHSPIFKYSAEFSEQVYLKRFLIHQNKFGENYYKIDDSVKVVSFIERPNPLSLIYKRLGFPYLLCMSGRSDLTKLELLENCVEKYQRNETIEEIFYEYDSQGRITARFWNDSKDKEMFEYY